MPLLNSPAPTLRRRLIVSLSAFALVLIALFSGFALLMAYVVEDGYLAAALQLEAGRYKEGQVRRLFIARPYLIPCLSADRVGMSYRCAPPASGLRVSGALTKQLPVIRREATEMRKSPAQRDVADTLPAHAMPLQFIADGVQLHAPHPRERRDAINVFEMVLEHALAGADRAGKGAQVERIGL